MQWYFTLILKTNIKPPDRRSVSNKEVTFRSLCSLGPRFHVQKSCPSNFACLTFSLFRNGFNCWFLLWFPGSWCSESSSGQIHSCLWSNKSRWSKILPQIKTQRNKLSNKRFLRQFRWFLAEILESEGLGFKPCSRSVFINRINSKFFKRGKEEYAFSVDKKTHDRKIRLCTYLQRWL